MAIRFRIATKIFALAVGLLALTVALSFVGTVLTGQLRTEQDRIADQYLPLHGDLDDVDTFSFKRELAFERRLALATLPSADPRDVENAADVYQDHNAHVTASIGEAEKKIAALLTGTAETNELSQLRRLLEEVKRDGETLDHLQERILKHRNLRDAVGEKDVRDTYEELHLNLEHSRTDMEDQIGALIDHASQGARQLQRRLSVITFSATAFGVLFGLASAWLVTRRMVHPVNVLMTGVQSVEKGDLSIQIPVLSTDEIGVLTGYFNRLVGELRSKERMKETFGKYIDPRIVEKVILNPGSAETEGGKRVMTVSFCDLVGFTGISENLTPTGLVRLLNRHFGLVADAIHAYQGVLDKFIGDAAMAFWGPPFSAEGDHATQACRAALAQIRVLETLRLELPELTGIRRNLPVVDLRVGVASGDVVVGNIGADQARTYTVIGDTVNLASRLEGANRVYGTRILISGETRHLAAEAIETREIDSIAVKGKTETAVAYELLGLAGEVVKEKLEIRDRYEEGLAAYRKCDWAAAQVSMRGVLELAPADGPARNPPAPGWDGVWHALEK
jgi:adenylate cyclase